MVNLNLYFIFDNKEISHRLNTIPNNPEVSVYEQAFFIQSEIFSDNDSILGTITYSKLDRQGIDALDSEGGDIFLHFKNDPILLENELNKIPISKENLQYVKNVLLGRKIAIPYLYPLLTSSNNDMNNAVIVYSSIISTCTLSSNVTLIGNHVTMKVWKDNKTNNTISHLSFDV